MVAAEVPASALAQFKRKRVLLGLVVPMARTTTNVPQRERYGVVIVKTKPTELQDAQGTIERLRGLLQECLENAIPVAIQFPGVEDLQRRVSAELSPKGTTDE